MYRKILVVVDDRAVTQSAIRQAIEMATVHRADIIFFYLLPRYVLATGDMLAAVTLSQEEFQRHAHDQAHAMLMAASRLAERAGVQSFRSMGSGADDVQCICDMASNRHCDLIVVGTDGHNAVMRILSGSVIPGLITAATVPVLVCRGNDRNDPHGRRARATLRARQRREERSRSRRNEDND